MNEWHLDPTLADHYAAGALTGPVAASVEAHVARCAPCQAALATRAPRSRLDSIWAEVADRVDAPRERLVERLLVRLGLPQGDARLVACAPALRLAWVLSVCAALVFTVAASSLRPQGVELFLLIAPILPVVGVGLAYGPWTDPMYETSVTRPLLRCPAPPAAHRHRAAGHHGPHSCGRRPGPGARIRVRLAAAQCRAGRGHPRAGRLDPAAGGSGRHLIGLAGPGLHACGCTTPPSRRRSDHPGRSPP